MTSKKIWKCLNMSGKNAINKFLLTCRKEHSISMLSDPFLKIKTTYCAPVFQMKSLRSYEIPNLL